MVIFGRGWVLRIRSEREMMVGWIGGVKKLPVRLGNSP